MLSESQIERYSRQIILRTVGGRGQERLLDSAIVIAGNHPAADTALAYLAGAGVGRLTHVGGGGRAAPGGPDVTIVRRSTPSTAGDFAALASTCAMVVGVGPVGEIQAVHDACTVAGRPLLWGFAAAGQAWVARLGPGTVHGCPVCLGALVARAGAPAREDPLTPVAAAWAGTVLATEALKILLGMPESLLDRYLALSATETTVAPTLLTAVSACVSRSAASMTSPSSRP